MRILVTGGAGYIGSHTVRDLINSGHTVTVLDNLSKGHQEAVDPRASFIVGNLSNQDLIIRTLQAHKIEVVMHFAGLTDVRESVHEPYKYYFTNFSLTLNLLSAMIKAGVKNLVYSSSAAIYGNPDLIPIVENEHPEPITPYGRSKLMAETAIEDFSHAYNLNYIILRYFNVAGASTDSVLGEDHHPESHLIPRILHAAQEEGVVEVFGTDYQTPDGTCIRDFVHVLDVSRAHVLAVDHLRPGIKEVFNIGSDRGFSVKEVITACEKATGKKIGTIELKRRVGDPAILIANSQKIRKVLKWLPLYPSIDTIVAHSWHWHSSHPEGHAEIFKDSSQIQH
ncbi:UDP-glucose 4-epimerase GalE [Peredibacter starrii]|uniref:UDP-glucose 4-epimerase n=1 Tax=Peredibacter starrii TaxID=28202 RepID=A0AAX4HR33_9BACT|nr:UDP-glucose 4-epimerase GalE [Peredibacter starrii]WPU65692.1 UDP-glucose 4-epimerase GalE [Peredibacter starrii]